MARPDPESGFTPRERHNRRLKIQLGVTLERRIRDLAARDELRVADWVRRAVRIVADREDRTRQLPLDPRAIPRPRYVDDP